MLVVLSVLLIILIFLQNPKQESLGTAFSVIYKTKLEKLLTISTYIVFGILCLMLGTF